ncbi:MAG TPA: PSD1 and planctomycete cytochrome C domain-containing protein [Pirellulaceae bacterium]|nr:PSD1 and planctomycete cytochrome C domain-containing protein [Pirellulaceae bacterium]
MRYYLSALVALLLLADPTTSVADAPLTFEQDIRPIFKAYCLDCHGATDELEGGLDLRLRRFAERGGESGAAIVPGDAEKSYLVERLARGEMPPGEKKLSAEQIETIRRWIASGAATASPEPEMLDPGIGITPAERAFWSFQPNRRPDVPSFSTEERIASPIDAFVLTKLKEHGLSFSPEADKLTQLKRAYFGLTGLPPTPEQLEAFLADESTEAYARLIDTLLESPRYGERWARHWLDVAGYADTEGYTNADADRPWAYKYRDYVIKSLNEGKPLDQFIQEQLAGDELVPLPHSNLAPEQIEKLVATGFLRMAADGTGSGSNDDAARNQTIADTLKIVSTSLLGLSVGCAQCHDHRYDPIPQKDYYQLRAMFEPALSWKQWRTPQQRLISLYTDEDRANAATVEAEAQTIAAEKGQKQATYMAEAFDKELQKYDEALRVKLRDAYTTPGDKRNDEQTALLKQYPAVNISPGTLYQYNQAAADDLKKYDERIAETRSKKPVEEFMRVLTEPVGGPPETHLFHRGEYREPKDTVTPAALTISSPPGKRVEIASVDTAIPTTGRRLAYARWLTSGEHPLVARVIVNRVWMHHFGRGIVGTPADFGVLGERPSHPELLDWLASEFMASGWNLKQLHKLIMTSTVYRQSSQATTDGLAADSGNTLYWRMPIHRLDAEALRDRTLAASGTLVDQLYGAPINIKADDTGQVIVDGDESRRSIYIRVKRTQPVAMLTAFDAPVMEVNCERRPSSTAATQALMMMNSEFVLGHARKVAERVRATAGAETTGQQIVAAWQITFCRPPRDEELAAATTFLDEQTAYLQAHPIPDNLEPSLHAMTNLCQALLSSNEFLYVD